MSHWRCTLVETREPHAQLDLGMYEAKTREIALSMAGNRFKSLMKRMGTGTWTIDAKPCAAPPKPQGRRRAAPTIN